VTGRAESDLGAKLAHEVEEQVNDFKTSEPDENGCVFLDLVEVQRRLLWGGYDE